MAKKKNGKSNGHNVDRRTIPKDKRAKPVTGQSADERELPYETLNEDEQEVLSMLDSKGAGKRLVRSIEFMSEGLSGDNPKLQTRNALRRLVSCGWVDWVSRGQYQVSERGRKRLARA